MTLGQAWRHISCSLNSRRIDFMEIVDSPLNLAHQQCRKADRFLASGKYEEAISCHSKAAELLRDAMKTTVCSQARLSMELQMESHVKQQRLIQERWKREVRREATKTRPGSAHLAAHTQREATNQSQPQTLQGLSHVKREGTLEREYDTLLYQLQTRQAGSPLRRLPSCPGSKTTKDDKIRLEEQQTTIEDLRRLVEHLMDENQRLSMDNERLRLENTRLRSEAAEAADFVEGSELWVLPHAGGGVVAAGGQERKSKGKEITIPQLPPLEMPAQEDLCLDDLPPLELPEDIQHELQELLDREKL